MTRHSGARLTVQAALLSDPPLWCWEILDATSGVLVESSWQNRWEAYASPGEALRQAGPALRRLSRGPRLDAVLRPRAGACPAVGDAPIAPQSLAVGDDRLAPARAPGVGIRHMR